MTERHCVICDAPAEDGAVCNACAAAAGTHDLDDPVLVQIKAVYNELCADELFEERARRIAQAAGARALADPADPLEDCLVNILRVRERLIAAEACVADDDGDAVSKDDCTIIPDVVQALLAALTRSFRASRMAKVAVATSIAEFLAYRVIEDLIVYRQVTSDDE